MSMVLHHGLLQHYRARVGVLHRRLQSAGICRSSNQSIMQINAAVPSACESVSYKLWECREHVKHDSGCEEHRYRLRMGPRGLLGSLHLTFIYKK